MPSDKESERGRVRLAFNLDVGEFDLRIAVLAARDERCDQRP